MRLKSILAAAAIAAVAFPLSLRADIQEDYEFGSEGIFVLNEDWYGHFNGSVNWLMPEKSDEECWEYRVFNQVNPDHKFGCTSQYAQIWNGRMYVISKQEIDPGDNVVGGRITICDAKTMKMIKQLATIDPSGKQCDGRGFVGVTASKGYVTTSNGAWILDLDNFEILGQVEGSANPNAGGDNDKPNYDPTSSLYFGQVGSAVLSDDGKRVFMAHQQYGLLVIDTETDVVTDVLPFTDYSEEFPQASIGSVVKARNGQIWCSISKDTKGTGAVVRALCHVDPVTLEKEYIDIPEDKDENGEYLYYAPANSWYAWTADGFCAAPDKDALYWNGGKGSWFSNKAIFSYDYTTGEFKRVVDLSKNDPDDSTNGWKLYGAAMRPDPRTGDIYMALYREFGQPTYRVRRYDTDGNFKRDYPMIAYYWFPALFLFPEDGEGGAGIGDITIDSSSEDNGIVYDLMGRRMPNHDNLAPGIYIRGGKKFLVR